MPKCRSIGVAGMALELPDRLAILIVGVEDQLEGVVGGME